MPGSWPFLRRRHVSAAAVWSGRDGAIAAWPTNWPQWWHRIARGRSGADGIEPPLRSFGPSPGARGRGGWHRGALGQRTACARRGRDDRSDDRHPERSARPLALELSLPGSTRRRRELISGLGTHPAELARRAAADQETCGVYSGYSDDTAADNMSSRQSRTCRAYRKDTQIRARDNGIGSCPTSCRWWSVTGHGPSRRWREYQAWQPQRPPLLRCRGPQGADGSSAT